VDLEVLFGLEDNDAEGRFELQFGLAENSTEGVAELRELAEGLDGAAAAIVADGFEGTEPGADPVRLGVRCKGRDGKENP
jgi:hypothetical protein